MSAPHEKLATSLARLQELQKGGRRVFQSKELTRVHRERLLANGFILEVMKGWLISSGPSAAEGDTTPWYASFWEFCTRYCKQRFGDEWHLSPEQSLLLHAENTVIPHQVIVYTPKGTNNTIGLLFSTSLYDLKQKQMPPARDLTVREGLRLYSPEAAFIRVPEAFYTRSPVEARMALSQIRDASDVLDRLLAGGHSAVAGRLAGAFRRIGRGDVAGEILSAMKAAGYDVREIDPFESQYVFETMSRSVAPIVGRIQTLWASMRSTVIGIFPEAPGPPKDRDGYMGFVDGIYRHDAYHSLSIEGYSVTPELIEKVASGDWHPATHEDDRESRDALAARGYWQAFQLVKDTIVAIITGQNAGKLVSTAHRAWYRELFKPCVTAGLIPPSALAGYRNNAVFLSGSRHVPPRWEAVRDAMPELFSLLEQEPEPCVRAVLGHWLVGYIHPYQDGNGRMARFLMNAMLASGGYPWTVIRVEDRTDYLAALESASINTDIEPLAKFIARRVRWSMAQARKRQ
jgi:fido (protein-threonine AMPylation protein)